MRAVKDRPEGAKSPVSRYVPETPEEAAKSLREWLYQGPYKGKPFRDFVPPGEFARIGPLIDNPAKDWPWPYEPSELDAALACLPERSREKASQQIVFLARVYLAKAWVEVRGPKGKPNPVEELRSLKDAADELIRSIANLSEPAIRQLRTKLRLNAPDAPDTIQLRFAVDAFLHEHRYLRNLPKPMPSDRRGRKVAVLERDFQGHLDQIFLEAHGGVRQKRGFPAFRKAVVDPLKGRRSLSVEESSFRDLRRPSDRSTRQRRRKSPESDI